MPVIALFSAKGGSGKTTCAIAVALEWTKREKRVLLVDADPQGSARAWAQRAAQSDDRLPTVIALDATLARDDQLPSLAEAFDIIVIDTPARDRAIQRAVLKVADLVIVPCSPSVLDTSALGATIDLFAETREERELLVRVLLNRAPLDSLITPAARELIEKRGLSVFDTAFSDHENTNVDLRPSQTPALITELENLFERPAPRSQEDVFEEVIEHVDEIEKSFTFMLELDTPPEGENSITVHTARVAQHRIARDQLARKIALIQSLTGTDDDQPEKIWVSDSSRFLSASNAINRVMPEVLELMRSLEHSDARAAEGEPDALAARQSAIGRVHRHVSTLIRELRVIRGIENEIRAPSTNRGLRPLVLDRPDWKLKVEKGVTTTGLGIMIAGGYMQQMICRGSKVPAEASYVFGTSRDDQSEIRFILLSGELPRGDRPIGEVRLARLPRAKKNQIEIEVTLVINGHGVITASARDAKTGLAPTHLSWTGSMLTMEFNR